MKVKIAKEVIACDVSSVAMFFIFPYAKPWDGTNLHKG